MRIFAVPLMRFDPHTIASLEQRKSAARRRFPGEAKVSTAS
jgi:hypothetical protein